MTGTHACLNNTRAGFFTFHMQQPIVLGQRSHHTGTKAGASKRFLETRAGDYCIDIMSSRVSHLPMIPHYTVATLGKITGWRPNPFPPFTTTTVAPVENEVF